jgi:hypothetical protein
MVRSGREMLARRGLDERVHLVVGDMRDFRTSVRGRIDLLSSIFSLHHLPTYDDLIACLREAAVAITTQEARLWIFDHARPRREGTARRFPEIFTPDASSAFKLDSCNSLKASWSFHELRKALGSTLDVPVNSSLARLLPLYQVHWLGQWRTDSESGPWKPPASLLASARRDAESLAKLFNHLPGR